MKIFNWLFRRNINVPLKYKYPEKPVFGKIIMPDGAEMNCQIGTIRQVTEKELKRDKKIKVMEEKKRALSVEAGIKNIKKIINEGINHDHD